MRNKIVDYWNDNYLFIGFIVIVAINFLVFISTLPTEIKNEPIAKTIHGKCLIHQYQSMSEFECEITPDGGVIDFNKRS